MTAPASSPIDRLRAWYAGLAPREQRTVTWGALGGGVLLLVAIVAQLHWAIGRAEQRVERKRADLAFVQAALPELRAAPVPQGGGESLVIVVDRTTRDAGLAMHLRGTEPAGQNQLRVRLEGAPFDATVNWVLRLQREYGTRIEAASLQRTPTAGVVDASLTLARP